VKVYKTLQQAGEYVLTLPGAYHAGFSMGLNIGEAVNFASKSWLAYGVKAQNIYRLTREKIPVFPFEWLLIMNIVHIEKVQVDLETKRELANSF
jgi:histone demethylase JARID1